MSDFHIDSNLVQDKPCNFPQNPNLTGGIVMLIGVAFGGDWICTILEMDSGDE